MSRVVVGPSFVRFSHVSDWTNGSLSTGWQLRGRLVVRVPAAHRNRHALAARAASSFVIEADLAWRWSPVVRSCAPSEALRPFARRFDKGHDYPSPAAGSSENTLSQWMSIIGPLRD